MKVILLQELRGKGGEGDVVDVATGYAVNYLFPRKIAIEATTGNLKQLKLRQHNIAKRETSRLDTAEKILAAFESRVIYLRARVGEEGQLFGSITTAQIAEALSTLHNIEVDRRSIDTRGSIKTIGEHTAIYSVYRDIRATIQIMVVDENAPEEEPEAKPADESDMAVDENTVGVADDASAEKDESDDAVVCD